MPNTELFILKDNSQTIDSAIICTTSQWIRTLNTIIAPEVYPLAGTIERNHFQEKYRDLQKDQNVSELKKIVAGLVNDFSLIHYHEDNTTVRNALDYVFGDTQTEEPIQQFYILLKEYEQFNLILSTDSDKAQRKFYEIRVNLEFYRQNNMPDPSLEALQEHIKNNKFLQPRSAGYLLSNIPSATKVPRTRDNKNQSRLLSI